MMGVDLRCQVERGFPVALIRLSGTLDLISVARVRATMAKCLADQPTAVVIDVSDLAVVDDLLLLMFMTVSRRAAEWPGSAILLCSPGPELAEALRRTATARHVQIYPTRSAALAAARAHPVPKRIREIYLPSRDAPGHARSVTAIACENWSVPEVSGIAQVIVSELVANAVVHARTMLELSLALRGQFLHISVRDGDRRVVRPPDAVADDAESGRGLLVIGALASSWGIVRTGDGKIIWAVVRIRL